MAGFVLTAAGSFVGNLIAPGIGGFIGGAIGAGLGGAIDQALFAPKPPNVEGPRLKDLSVSSSAYGQPLPLAFGTVRLGANVIWSTDLIETRHSKKVKGGKGGRKSSTQVSYTYSCSFAAALCEGPIVAVRRIWGDGKLFYDNGSQQHCADVRIYLGDDAQSPDSLIQSHVGAADTPAYRGIAYVVFDAMQLADFANRIPQITAEVEIGTASAASVIVDLCTRTGAVPCEASALDTVPLRGFVVSSNTTGEAAIGALLSAFNAIAANAQGVATFRPRDAYAPIGIDGDDLGAAEDEPSDQDIVKIVRTHDAGIPREVAITFMDPERDYQSNTQRAVRLIGDAEGISPVEMPLVMSADEGKRLAETLLFSTWARRSAIEKIALPPAWQFLRPGDVLDVTMLLGRVVRTRVIKTAIGANGLVEVEAQFEDSSALRSAASAGTGTVPGQQAGTVPATIAHLLDIPILRAEDDGPGFYVAAGSLAPAIWRGAAIYRSADDVGFDELVDIADAGILGAADGVLPSGPEDVFDRASSVDVTLDASLQLYSVTEDNVRAGANAALLGDEIIQFASATLLGPGKYRLATLLRGRRGTGWAMAGHVAGERFVLLSSGAGLERISDGTALIGIERFYRAVTVNQSLLAVTSTAFTNTARGLKPLSPSFVAICRDAGSGDLTISWLPRTRIPSDWQNGVDAPFGESIERYRVEVMSGAVVKRELVVDDARQAIYAAALQTADFGGPVTTSLKVRVSQYSEIVGWGWPTEATLPIARVAGQAVFARFNSADKSSGVTLSNADLTASTAASAINAVRTTTSKAAGKYYIEFTIDVAVGGSFVCGPIVGNASMPLTNFADVGGNGIVYWQDGRVFRAGVLQGTIQTFASGDVVGVALDLDNKKIWYRRGAGAWNNNAGHNPATNAGGFSVSAITGNLFAGWQGSTTSQATLNPGSSTYAYPAPAGFLALG
jgi:hypothetical protein